ncbi:DUF3099 domain-containing protein [Citricoccus nitrophenolicus]|uniref:DUF3099 domain-containing protein n=1 Tax=Citricoccus nitrophenolicus TaxID=863575 RepID=A0ABV0IFC1_9MICC|nr:DUF3099 domain-containing protein [Citricoccus sp. I39-566]WMY77325.1 DUF3099 domain-containing protein [Citricoccus sp. I39-566]
MTTRHAETGHRAGHSPRRDPGEGVQRITSAPEAGHVDRDARFARYAWQMAIRTACFIGAFFTTGWVQIVLFIAAIVLPYLAVVLANNGTVSNGSMVDAVPPAPPAAPELGSRLELTAAPETIQGEAIHPDDRAA